MIKFGGDWILLNIFFKMTEYRNEFEILSGGDFFDQLLLILMTIHLISMTIHRNQLQFDRNIALEPLVRLGKVRLG